MDVRNRFKGLDLIDRVPDELWTEVCDIVQETEIKCFLVFLVLGDGLAPCLLHYVMNLSP